MRWLDDIGLFLIYLISFWFRYFDRMNFLRFQHNKKNEFNLHASDVNKTQFEFTSLHRISSEICDELFSKIFSDYSDIKMKFLLHLGFGLGSEKIDNKCASFCSRGLKRRLFYQFWATVSLLFSSHCNFSLAAPCCVGHNSLSGSDSCTCWGGMGCYQDSTGSTICLVCPTGLNCLTSGL